MANYANIVYNNETVEVKINNSDYKTFSKDDFKAYYPNLLHSIIPNEFDNIQKYTRFDVYISEQYCRYVFEYNDSSPVNLRIISEFQFDTMLVNLEYRKNYNLPEVNIKIYCKDYADFKDFVDTATKKLLETKDQLLVPPSLPIIHQ